MRRKPTLVPAFDSPLHFKYFFSLAFCMSNVVCVWVWFEWSEFRFDNSRRRCLFVCFPSQNKAKWQVLNVLFECFPPLPPLFKKVIPRCRLFLLLFSSPLLAANLAVLSSLIRVIICTNSLSSSPSPLVYFNSISRTRILNVNQQCCANWIETISSSTPITC